MRTVDLIRRKRDGAELTRDEIRFLVRGATDSSIPDYQLSAWLMAVLWRGMSSQEIAALTEAMLHSGAVLDLSSLPAPAVDKHSTGGVGDKASLVVAPVVAAAGLYVPMISGRGLGHTGGTLDKLESIPGFNVSLSLEEFRAVLESCHCALIGQTPEIAPADRKLYALRDVTGTVESPALICASIMSKKLAEGAQVLVFDVKTGSGAFMKQEHDARHLAGLLVDTAARMGRTAVALLTDMDQPLGHAVGNALEVREAIDVLLGAGPDDVRALSLELSAWMLHLGGLASSFQAALELAALQISSGRAIEKFREILRDQGADPNVVGDPHLLPRAAHSAEICSPSAGFVSRIACEQIGLASTLLGGGRSKAGDSIDPAVGLTILKKVGHAVQPGDPLLRIHFNDPAGLADARALLERSFAISEISPPPATLVRGIIGPAGAAPSRRQPPDGLNNRGEAKD